MRSMSKELAASLGSSGSATTISMLASPEFSARADVVEELAINVDGVDLARRSDGSREPQREIPGSGPYFGDGLTSSRST